MPKVSYDVLVLDANSRKALATIRSLGKRGLRVAALEVASSQPVPAFSSRWCQKHMICPAEEGTEEYLLYLESLMDTLDIRVLLPLSDGTIALVRQHRARLEQHVRIALASEAALSIAVSKERTLTMAKQLGLDVPHSIALKSTSETEMALREVGLPAVVKPVESWVASPQHGCRLASRLVTTPGEARLAVEELTSSGGAVLFQQFLCGKQEAIALISARGDTYARFAYWSRREDPPLGGTSVLAQSIAYPADIGEQAERLVRAIGLEGYSQVEFRRDGAGKPYLMEINARLTAGLEHPIQAGVDFPYLLYQWASGKQIDIVEGYRAGVQMRYLWGDIAGTVAAVRQRGRPGVPPAARVLFDFCISFLIPMRYDYVDWRDPLPLLVAIDARARGGMRRLAALLARRRTRDLSEVSRQHMRKAETSHV